MKAFFSIVLFISISSSLYANELTKIRKQDSIDNCKVDGAVNNVQTFGEQIRYWVNHFESNEVDLSMDEINTYYDVKDGLAALSTRDLNFCEVDKASLSRSLKNVPDEETIKLLNAFFNENTDYEKLYTCLAKEESLGDPDTESSIKVFKKFSNQALKPAGVKFYWDKEQPKGSALNIGLFQFTPNINGNIRPCVLSWNKMFKSQTSCQIKSNDDALAALASSGQNFNAYCGLHKVIETASIQMKSIGESRKFKPGQSCVSLQMKATLAYNHFGPFQNSTGKNLKSLAKCINATNL